MQKAASVGKFTTPYAAMIFLIKTKHVLRAKGLKIAVPESVVIKAKAARYVVCTSTSSIVMSSGCAYIFSGNDVDVV